MKKFKAIMSHSKNLELLEKYFSTRADAFNYAKNYNYVVETITEVSMSYTGRGAI